MHPFLRKLWQNEFFKNVTTLLTGTGLAQLVSILIYLVISRFYSEEDFGVFGLYMNILNITILFSTAKYELAILLPRSEKEALHVLALCNVISVTLGAFLWIVLLLLHGHLLVWLRNDAIGPWLWFLPLSTVLVGLFQSYRNHANRGKAYGLIARANVVQSVGNALLKLVLGLLLAGAAGLIIGVVFGQLAGLLVFLLFHLPLLRRTGEPIRIAEMKRLAREYRLFPRYNLWQGLINNLSGAFPVFVLNGQFSTAQAGLYTFAYMVLYRPVNLVASAFYQVMFQRFVEKKHQEEDLLPGIRLFLKRSIQILALPFLLMALFAPEVFSFLFSDTWLEAGRYARILLPWLFMTALVMPLSFVPDLYKRQRGAMILDGIKMILRLGGLWAGVMRDDVFLSLALFSGASTVMLLISLLWYLHLVKHRPNPTNA